MKLVLKVFWRSMREKKRIVFWWIPVMLMVATLWIIEPLYARFAIDDIFTEDPDFASFLPVFGGWLGLYVLINIANAVNMYMRWKIQNNLLANTRQMYYEKLLGLDISHHVKARGGELMKKIEDATSAVVQITRETVLNLTPSFITATAFYIISFMISWQLALLSISLLPLYILSLWISLKYTRKNTEKVNKLWVEAIGRGYDTLSNIFTVKSSAAEERELKRMENTHREGIKNLEKVNKAWAFLEALNFFMLMRIILIGAGMYLLAHDELSLGSLFFFQFTFFRLIAPIEMVGAIIPQWNELNHKIRMAEELYNQNIDVTNRDDAKTLSSFNGDITFRDVTFSYGTLDALSDITLDIKAGEHVALVGHSGAGKSTIAMLLNRFYDVKDGSILIDGIDIRELDVHWWRNQIGLVLQENIMFNDSIMNNIRYTRPDATDEEVMEAAKRASAHEFISNLQKGYDSEIGERGIRLSGGERQRVAIARAILKNPSIVVLDEATSALDSITERDVQDGIKELIQGKTAIIIAHRLSTVRSVDRIAVLDKGKIIAVAPHEELMKTCDIYKEMVDLQSQGLLAE